jgi:F-box protein 9
MAASIEDSDTLLGQQQPPDDALKSFRAEWKRELEGSQQSQTSSQEEDQLEKNLHTKAREYFEKGVALEESGKLYDAIKFYKKAVQLVPDIEKEVYQASSTVQVNKPRMRESSRVRGEDENHNPVDADGGDNLDDDLDNLVDRFSRAVCLDNTPSIQQECAMNLTHIGVLPAELLNLILKWVVSADLDLRSLESCACVCKGFYLAARDQEIWKQICTRAFGRSALAGNTDSMTWRQFYLSGARVHYNGCYVSKMTYMREGERGFQDHENFRAWHMVTYYRLIRLFPGGRMLMVLSADDPSLTAKLMNNRNFCSIQGGLYGEYRVVDNKLVCILHKQKHKPVVQKFRRKRRDSMIYNDVPDQDYLLEFQIKGKKSKLLYWSSYQIISRYSGGRETEDMVTLNEQKFPRMQFTKVGSFHFESAAPL